MKFLLRKKSLLVIIAVLVGFLVLSALMGPGHLQTRTTPTPTPTLTPTPQAKGELLEAGDTTGMRWGAVAILLIILGGVLIQWVLTRPERTNPG
jgi:hypothetical protein